MTDPGKDHRPVWVCFLLLAATLAAYWPVFRCEFINLDDPDYVLENPAIRAGFTLQALKWAFTTYYATNWHPVTWLSHILDFKLYGLSPTGMHLTNLVFHAANTLLLFLLLRRMTGALWRSAFVAGLFALHPLHVESVAWISERKDVLSTFFGLLSIWAYASYVKAESRKQKAESGFRQPVSGFTLNASPFYLLSLLLFALSLMSKPMLVTLPFILLLLDYWPLQRLKLSTLNSQLSTIFEKLPFLALAVADSVLTVLAQKSGHAVVSLDLLPAHARIPQVLVSYVRYLGKVVWPVDLCIFYPPRAWAPWEPVLAALLLLGLTTLVLWGRRQAYLVTGWFWFLGTLVPVIGIVAVGGQSIADRYMYLPLVGLSICVAWGVLDLLRAWPGHKPLLAVSAAMLLLACAVMSARQVSSWRNSLTLFEHALRVIPRNVVAHYHYGLALEEENRLKEAIQHYQEALRIVPRLARAHVRLGAVLGQQGNHNEAITHNLKALEFDPANAEAHDNLGAAYLARGKSAEAETHFREAVRLTPDSAWFHSHLGGLLLDQGKLDAAMAQFQEALAAWPYSAEIRVQYASALLQKGALDQAMAECEEALRLDPKSGQAHYHWGDALLRRDQRADGIAHWREAIRLKSAWPELLNNLAWLLSTSSDSKCRDGAEAVRLAEAARLLDTNNLSYLDTLAAAYAEVGRFADATNVIQKAITQAGAVGQTNSAARFRSRLQLYQTHQPYREPSRTAAADSLRAVRP